MKSHRRNYLEVFDSVSYFSVSHVQLAAGMFFNSLWDVTNNQECTTNAAYFHLLRSHLIRCTLITCTFTVTTNTNDDDDQDRSRHHHCRRHITNICSTHNEWQMQLACRHQTVTRSAALKLCNKVSFQTMLKCTKVGDNLFQIIKRSFTKPSRELRIEQELISRMHTEIRMVD